MLFLLTLLHLTVDGICGAALYEYTLNEPVFESILLIFAIYNIVAFGAQG